MRRKRSPIIDGACVGLALVTALCVSMAPALAEPAPASLSGAPGLARLKAACTGPQLAAEGMCARTVAVTSRAGHKRVVRFGRVNDSDNVFGDNVFNPATGEAFCKGNEQVVTGGKQIISTSGLFGGPARVSDGESAPDLKKPGRGWKVGFGSDLGGLARRDFRVVVVCET